MSDASERARAFREAFGRGEARIEQASDLLESLTPADIVRVIPILGSVSVPHGSILAQAGSAMLSHRLNEDLIQHLDKLDASNEKLTKVGWLLALVGILVAVVDVLVELKAFA